MEGCGAKPPQTCSFTNLAGEYVALRNNARLSTGISNMWTLFLTGVARYFGLLWQTLAGFFDADRRFTGALLLLLIFPLLLLLQVIHWLLWAVDEIAFHRYRNVNIESPVFVIGAPRTGTTFLHHVLAGDPGFTTFRLWECLFGITISGRKLCLGLAAVDRFLGRPVAGLIDWISRRGLSAMDDVHPLRLDEPEEDFLVFMPFAGCLVLLVPFPNASWLWSMSELDTRLNDKQKQRIMCWYRRCIQKHLYVFGTDSTFLSKNASFAGTAEALLQAFPDARILSTWRRPEESVPSQLSSLRPGLDFFGFQTLPEALKNRFVDMMAFYYRHLERIERQHPDRVARISTDDMKRNLRACVEQAFSTVGLPVSEALRQHLDANTTPSSEHQSTHAYSLEEFGLSCDLIRSRFRSQT